MNRFKFCQFPSACGSIRPWIVQEICSHFEEEIVILATCPIQHKGIFTYFLA